MEIKSIGELVRDAEDNDLRGETTISKYVQWSMRENLEKIDAYLNSKHTTGDTDSMGREKPFFNICTAAVNIWFRATDIDRKNIRIKATKAAHYILSFIATILLQEFMRKEAFGAFLNEWGRTLAKYGSAILKFIEKDTLHCEVMPWNRMIVDSVDFENNIKIEKLWLTPAQLKKQKGYDQELVEKLLNNLSSRETSEGHKKDTKSEYIPIYEVHGELPLSYLTDKEKDEDTYQQQMHVLTFLEKKDKGYDDYSLYSGKEKQDPYIITHLIREDGRTQAIGAVEHLFEAQWMLNHTVKAIKDQLDLASKLIFQTSDGNFVGQNALTAIENGDILIHALNQPLTELNNSSHDITALQAFGSQWKVQSNEIVGISESMLGINPSSGTAWRLEAAKLQEAHSLFEIMTENKGLHIEEMLRKYIIPYLKKQMNTSEEISAILESHQITQLDSMYVPNEAIRRSNKKIVHDVLNKSMKDILAGNLLTPEQQTMDIQAETQDIQKELSSFGNQRFIKPSDIPTETWKDVLKDLEWEVEVDVTGEAQDTQAVMTTLTTVLQTIASNPAILQDPNMKLLFNRILEQTGAISPVELSQQPQPVQSVGQPVGSAAGQQPVMK